MKNLRDITLPIQNVLTRLDMTRAEIAGEGYVGCADDVAYGIAAIERLNQKIARLESALNSCLEYLDGMVDVVDGDYGIPAPNREMQLINEINEALDRGGY